MRRSSARGCFINQLVERNNRAVLLTAVGQEVVERAKAILTDVDDVVSLCEASREPFQGTIRWVLFPRLPLYFADDAQVVKSAAPGLQVIRSRGLIAGLG